MESEGVDGERERRRRLRVVEDLAAAREARAGAAVSPVSTDPLAATAVRTHELHGGKGTSLPRSSYQLERRLGVDRFVGQPVLGCPGLRCVHLFGLDRIDDQQSTTLDVVGIDEARFPKLRRLADATRAREATQRALARENIRR